MNLKTRTLSLFAKWVSDETFSPCLHLLLLV
jgi:hypothetical protein